MKVTKLILGILMIIFSVIIFFQASIAGLGNSLQNNGEFSGTAGIFLAFLWLASGITYLATKSRSKLGGDIACLIMLAIAWLLGISNAGSYSDLYVWSWAGLIIGLGFFIWHFIKNRKKA